MYRLEEMTAAAVGALDRDRTVAMLAVSPLEQHGPHLPLGVDAFTARHFAEELARRLVAARPGWSVLLAPTLPLGSFTLQGPGTLTARPRVVRDALVDHGASLARAGFRFILVTSGHAGPTHLVALDEAAALVSRRHGVVMASLSGHLAWRFRSRRFLDGVEATLGRPLSDAERRAFAEDAHAGWWETSMMLMLRPDLVDGGWPALPPARYSTLARLVPDYATRGGGQGYVGHPALADPDFARATSEVLLAEGMALVNGLLDGAPAAPRRSPFYAVPLFRTGFWPLAATAALGLAALAWLRPRPPAP